MALASSAMALPWCMYDVAKGYQGIFMAGETIDVTMTWHGIATTILDIVTATHGYAITCA